MNREIKLAAELLAFYRDAGIDALVGDAPVDRMAEPDSAASAAEAASKRREPGAAAGRPPRKASPGATPPGATPPRAQTAGTHQPIAAPPPPPPPEVAVMAAREAATHADSLEALRTLMENFQGCALRATATQLVFADGNPHSRIMFVGEAPGYEEDVSGRAFVGPSGKLLDCMLAAIGLDRGKVYIANVVPWRPPGNRTPTPQETAICLPFIRRQIELANPDILVCLGQPATQTLLGTREGITRTRGRWFKYNTGSREIRALATLHPAYLLRQPQQKRLAWRDFLAIKKALAELEGAP